MKAMKRKTIVLMSMFFLSFLVFGSSAFAKSNPQKETKASNTQTQDQQDVLEENIKFLSKLSSESVEEVYKRQASPGVFVHGIALKPGKPTILGYDQHSGTLFVGLPGHPVAAMVVFELLVGWLHKKLMHHPDKYTLTACMETNYASAPGKTTCLLVKLLPASNGLVARPILGKSGLITTMTQADGYVLVDLNKEGLKAGEEVQVHLF